MRSCIVKVEKHQDVRGDWLCMLYVRGPTTDYFFERIPLSRMNLPFLGGTSHATADWTGTTSVSPPWCPSKHELTNRSRSQMAGASAHRRAATTKNQGDIRMSSGAHALKPAEPQGAYQKRPCSTQMPTLPTSADSDLNISPRRSG